MAWIVTGADVWPYVTMALIVFGAYWL